jgi:Zn-dependent protease/predicted transcriptional regulator
MRGWSFPAGRLFGVDIRIHVTFLFLLGFVWFAESPQMGITSSGRGLILVVMLFGSVVLHELAHAVVAKRSGIVVRSIILLPIGGITLIEDPGPSRFDPARDIRIAVAGPLLNLLVAAISAAVILLFAPQVDLWAQPWLHASNLPRSLFWGNLFLGAFNLLPAYPMDGGRILRALLAERMDSTQATRRAVVIGQIFAMALILAGAGSDRWLMVVGFFLFIGAQLEDRSAVFQSVLQSVRMEDVMLTHFSILSPADTLEDALDKAVHTLQDDFPVVRGMELVGVINKAHIVDALRRDGNGYVQPAMTKNFEVAKRNDSLGDALRKLQGRGLSMLPVVDMGRLVGIVTLQNLTHSMGLLAESRRIKRAEETRSEF